MEYGQGDRAPPTMGVPCRDCHRLLLVAAQLPTRPGRAMYPVPVAARGRGRAAMSQCHLQATPSVTPSVSQRHRSPAPGQGRDGHDRSDERQAGTHMLRLVLCLTISDNLRPGGMTLLHRSDTDTMLYIDIPRTPVISHLHLHLPISPISIPCRPRRTHTPLTVL